MQRNRGTAYALAPLSGIARITLTITLALALVMGVGGLFSGQAEAGRVGKAARPAKAAGKARADKRAAGSKRVKNQKLSQYAKMRPRGPNGRFQKLPANQKVARKGSLASALANPNMAGKSGTTISFTPARGKRAGKLDVKISEFYAGAAPLAAKSERTQIFARDIRGNTVAITGTLKVGPGRVGSAYRTASFEGQIPAGIRLSRQNITNAVSNSQLHVNGLTVQWSN